MQPIQDGIIPISIQEHITLILLASVIAYGTTEILKPFLKNLFTDKEKSRAVIRLFSIISGTIVGYTLGSAWMHIWFGTGAGILNSWIVAIVKKKLEERYNIRLRHSSKQTSDSKDEPPL